MESLVLRYYWESLKTLEGNFKLKAMKGLSVPKLSYGMVFNTKSFNFNYTVPPEASEWATYIQGYFETNKGNEDLIVALATDTIESKVSMSFLFPRVCTNLIDLD